jgi:hypothetical protein
MAASDYVPIFFKNRLHLEGRPQMGTRPNTLTTAQFGNYDFVREPSYVLRSRI